jgi:hypothetical protein
MKDFLGVIGIIMRLKFRTFVAIPMRSIIPVVFRRCGIDCIARVKLIEARRSRLAYQ